MIFNKFVALLTLVSVAVAQDDVLSESKFINTDILRPLPLGPCYGKYEVYIKYGPQCPQTCEWFSRQCTLRAPSVPGCYCQPGYVRDSIGNCVNGNTFCGNCTQFQQYLNPGPNCDTECATLGQKCTRVYIQAPFGCYCLPGYARDANNICVPIDQCTSKLFYNYFLKTAFNIHQYH